MAKLTLIIMLVAGLAIPGLVHSKKCDPADFPPGVAQFTHGPIAGAVKGRSAKIGFRTDAQACVQIKYATNPELLDALTSEAKLTKQSGDFTGNITLLKLSPETTYYYTIVVNGVDTNFPSLPRFKTFPRGKDPVSFTFGVLTDLGSNKPAPAMAALAQDDPDYVVILGDYDHRNPDTLAEMRAMHREVREERASGPDLCDNILRQFPVAHVWDDHDYSANNGDKTFPAKADAIKAFDEYWPTYGRRLAGKKNGLWHKFRYGSLADIYMLDLRSQRDVHTDPDDANKSMLDGDMISNSQKAWLKDNLRASTATWKLIASTVPWNPTVGGTKGKKDAWAGFQTEQQELVDFIRAEGITGVIFFSGDIHIGGAIDDGTNAYFPELNVPYTNNPSSNVTCGNKNLCGDWSEGWKPDGAGYGLVTVSPNSVLLQAKDEAGTVQYALTVPLAGPVPVAIDIAPGNNDNPINPDSNGYAVVAILSTNKAAGELLDFDALQVDPASVRFGPGKAAAFTSQSRDEDQDGDTDLVLYIRIQETGIACGDTEASLSGETHAGQVITGTDSIQTVGCE